MYTASSLCFECKKKVSYALNVFSRVCIILIRKIKNTLTEITSLYSYIIFGTNLPSIARSNGRVVTSPHTCFEYTLRKHHVHAYEYAIIVSSIYVRMTQT